MIRVTPTENVLSNEDMTVRKKKKKIRNYSFQQSKRLPLDKMTLVGGIKIPSMPGSCYHAIIAALAENKDRFCPWSKIVELTQRNMLMYGGQKAWEKFVSKSNVKSPAQRIKDNTHTLTRTGRDCYGYRLHEQGMCIYYFKDGAMLLTGGTLKSKDGTYDVVFPDKRRLQTRYRGTTMTYKEYKTFLDNRLIDSTGRILDQAGIKKIRDEGNEVISSEDILSVCIELEEGFNQQTATRLEALGLIVENGIANEILGSVPRSKINSIRADIDVKSIEVSGE